MIYFDYLPKRGHFTEKITCTGSEILLAYKKVSDIPGVSLKAGKLYLPPDYRLIELVAAVSDFSGSPSFKLWYVKGVKEAREILDIISLDDAQVDHPQAKNLYPFQRVGINFLLKRRNSLLADDCGLGKTVQAILAAECSGSYTNILVLCPNSVKGTWREEIEKWAEFQRDITIFESPKRKKQMSEFSGGWAIVNYEQFVAENGYASLAKWDWVICDEAHRLANRKTKVSRGVAALRPKNFALLTGTPMGNSPGELWSALHILYPERYTSYWRFFNMYVEYATHPVFGSIDILGAKNTEYLRKDLSSIMLQRKKEDVYKQLPDKTYQTINLDMNPSQEKYYKQMAKKLYVEISEGERLYAMTMMSKILRLRQILSTPYGLGLPDDSCKLDAVEDIVRGTTRRVLVFTLYRATVEKLSERLKDIPHAIVIGGIGQEEIERAKAALNHGKARVLIATLGAGGEGLTLTGASTVIFVDNHWNPIKQKQAEDRAHRVGQTKNVHIITLHCKGTVDDLVQSILDKKITMSEDILRNGLLQALAGHAS